MNHRCDIVRKWAGWQRFTACTLAAGVISHLCPPPPHRHIHGAVFALRVRALPLCAVAPFFFFLAHGDMTDLTTVHPPHPPPTYPD